MLRLLIWFVKIKTLGVIYDQIGENGSQISWTERHEALFMFFCPKSNQLRRVLNLLL
jgi:hypothetical protein